MGEGGNTSNIGVMASMMGLGLVGVESALTVRTHSRRFSTSILPFVQKIFFRTPTDRDYNDLGPYGSPMASAFPWAAGVPGA